MEDVIGRPLASDPSSKEALDTVRSWIKDCRENHEECGYNHSGSQPHQGREFPTRLLDVQSGLNGNHHCILIDGSDALGDYITLSYCWGYNQSLRTMTSNLGQHKGGIDLSNMPKTLQDAVHVTRELGIRYLWIDALCIVQDNTAEWRREALQMGRIYQDSYCTIAAAGAESSAGGLYIPRINNTNTVALPYVGRHSKAARGDFYISPAQHTLFNRVQDSIWNSRGWVLQERVLSRRIVLFAEGQTFFECQRQSQGEDQRDLRLYEQKRFGNKLLPQGEDWGWCLLVEDYTKRTLTQPHDKLYALAGLAENMTRRTGKRYCAGIWAENLHLHMLWYSAEGQMLRPPAQRAPSWSWAALDGPVMWEPSMLEAESRCVLSLLPRPPSLDTAPEENTSIVLRFEGRLTSIERSGEILETGRPSGLVGNLMYLIDIEKHGSCYALLAVGEVEDQSQRVGWAVFDEGITIQGPYSIAQISENNVEHDRKTRSSNVVVLSMVHGHSNRFRRVGMGEVIVADFFDGMPWKLAELV